MLADCVRALKGLALPRASHSSESTLSGSRRLRSTLVAAPVLFAHAVVTVAKNSTSATPSFCNNILKQFISAHFCRVTCVWQG
jgi:hypothetical protein